MKFKKKKSRSRKKIAIAVILVVVLALGGYGYWTWLTIPPHNTNDKNNSKENDNKKSKDKSNEQSTNQSDQSTIESEKNVTNDRSASGETLSVWVTSKNIVSGILQIRVQIDQNISNGTCTLTIGSYSTSVPVAFEPQSASCQGFDVSTSAYSGNSFTITVQDGNKSGSVTGAI
jgi:cytoskeletal protein RodZ